METMRQVSGTRLRALVRKEFNQIRRDRRLAISLILPPTLQLLLFGFALSANVTGLRLGVVDENRTYRSRELIAMLSESKSFAMEGTFANGEQLGEAMSQGKLDAGIVIPYAFSRDLERGRPVTVQFLLNAMNANTAAIGQGYAQGVIQHYNRTLQREGLHAGFRQIAEQSAGRTGHPQIQPTYLYNPGLEDSWFIVTGVFGLLVILNSTLISSATMVRERETGTI